LHTFPKETAAKSPVPADTFTNGCSLDDAVMMILLLSDVGDDVTDVVVVVVVVVVGMG
jgi:hypothetical protein